MIDWLVYLVTGGVAGFLLAFIYSLFRVGPGKPELNFAKPLAACLVITWVMPFVYVEAHTRSKLPKLKSAIEHWHLNSDDIDGTLDYIKVLHSTNDTAYVMVVGVEPNDLTAFEDRPVVRMVLKRKFVANRPKWEVVETNILRSERLNRDDLVWPPYQ